MLNKMIANYRAENDDCSRKINELQTKLNSSAQQLKKNQSDYILSMDTSMSPVRPSDARMSNVPVYYNQPTSLRKSGYYKPADKSFDNKRISSGSYQMSSPDLNQSPYVGQMGEVSQSRSAAPSSVYQLKKKHY